MKRMTFFTLAEHQPHQDQELLFCHRDELNRFVEIRRARARVVQEGVTWWWGTRTEINFRWWFNEAPPSNTEPSFTFDCGGGNVISPAPDTLWVPVHMALEDLDL